MQKSLTLRPICSNDDSLLFRIFQTVYEPDFEALDIPADQFTDLLRIQFNAQQQQYRRRYPDADFDVVLCDDKPAGSMCALRGPDRFALIDISLLPEYRNRGIGSELVADLISQARIAGKAVDAHVRRGNPAGRLWQRLGFEQVGDDGVYLQIRIQPAQK